MIHDTIFENLDAVFDYLSKLGWTLSMNYYGGNAPYEITDYSNGRIVYYPLPLFTPLFRGQNEFHNPCLTTGYRFEKDRTDFFIEELQLKEFGNVTSEHPAVKHEVDEGIFYNHVALAQHYEFKTDTLNLTNSLPVAAFFAVTKKEGNRFVPIDKTDKPGVLYFFNPELVVIGAEPESVVMPVGWQIFPQPCAQRAFVIGLPGGKDFHQISGVFAYRFSHDPSISKKIFDRFKGGELLFPFDPFADTAAKIKECNVFSESAFEAAYSKFSDNLSKDDWKMLLHSRRIDIVNNAAPLSEENILG